MKRNQARNGEEPGELEPVEDFLPPPDQLVLKEEGVKVTLALSQRSVAFFKHHAARSGVPYQRMIRNLLDSYVDRWSADDKNR